MPLKKGTTLGGPKASRPYMPGYGILARNKGKGLLAWTWATKRLKNAHIYWVSTVRPDKRPHAMAVWGVWFDDTFYFSTGARSRKARNLNKNPNCVISPVVSPQKGEEAVSLEGVANRVIDKSTMDRFARVYNGKYQWDMSSNKEPVYAVHPRAVYAFGGYNDFVGSATRWKFPDNNPGGAARKQ